MGSFFITDDLPVYDEKFYLNHAYSIYVDGVFGIYNSSKIKSEPSARVAPLYPAFLAMVMYLSQDYSDSTQCHIDSKIKVKSRCKNNFIFPKYIQLLFLAISFGFIWLALMKITSSFAISYLSISTMLVSGAPFYYANMILTESLYLPIAFLFLLTLHIAITKMDKKYISASAILLGLTALTRPSFYYLFFILLFIFPILFYISNTK